MSLRNGEESVRHAWLLRSARAGFQCGQLESNSSERPINHLSGWRASSNWHWLEEFVPILARVGKVCESPSILSISKQPLRLLLSFCDWPWFFQRQSALRLNLKGSRISWSSAAFQLREYCSSGIEASPASKVETTVQLLLHNWLNLCNIDSEEKKKFFVIPVCVAISNSAWLPCKRNLSGAKAKLHAFVATGTKDALTVRHYDNWCQSHQYKAWSKNLKRGYILCIYRRIMTMSPQALRVEARRLTCWAPDACKKGGTQVCLTRKCSLTKLE